MTVTVMCLAIWALEFERGIGATAAMVVWFFMFISFGNGLEIMALIAENPTMPLWIGAAYLIVGMFWSLAKWRMFAKDKLDEYEAYKINWLKSQGFEDVEALSQSVKEKFRKHLSTSSQFGYLDGHDELGKPLYKVRIRPLAREHKARITTWIAHWPLSLVWSILDDFVRRICRWIAEQLRDVMDGITGGVYRDAEKELFEDDNTPAPPADIPDAV